MGWWIQCSVVGLLDSARQLDPLPRLHQRQ
ncbi:unnamed protein product [Linum tenue]|uniref:Uncharacterized protein n=1 Tax=Linum tenue TaxID=586396 RepID=A0AAV0RPA9_9ROSI|nr:unnamed protein product [Linum tenue]